MRAITSTRARLILLGALATFAALVPTASADTTLPVWTCRASAGYVEFPSLLGAQRVEPVLANGFPIVGASDNEQCVNSTAGVDEVDIPAGTGTPATPLVNLSAAFARTTLLPLLGPARLQTATAAGGVTDATITLGALVINATALRADATGTCVGGSATVPGTPTLSGTSTVASLAIGGTLVTPIPSGTNPAPITIAGIGTVYFNREIAGTGPGAEDAALTRRAIQIVLLPGVGGVGTPAANIVLGEAKVDRHGAVCALPPTCPTGFVAQTPPPGTTTLVCLKTNTVVAPCPAGSTADPNQGGACIVIRNNDILRPCGTGTVANAQGTCVATATVCPAGSIRETTSNTCIVVRERPCPAGAVADPATRVCVVKIVQNTGSGNGENGRIGGPNGPRATCGRLDMFFVRRGFKSVGRTFTSRFGTRTVTRGRLVTCGANPRPIVGARIDVVHVLPNGQTRRKTGLRSRAEGKLTLILPNDLRSRRIEYAYRPDLRTTRVTSRVTLRLTVKDGSGRVLR